MFGSMFDEPVSSVDSVIRENAIENKSSFQQSADYSSSGKLFVVSVSGKAIVNEGLDEKFVRKFSAKVSQMHAQGLKFVLVVGKGSIARDFIETAKQFNASRTALDELALQFSKANALLLSQALDAAHPKIITEFSEAVSVLDSGRIPIMVPHLAGISAEGTAALAAEYLGGTLVNLTDVRGILSSTAKKGRLLKNVSFDDLLAKSLEMSLEPEGDAVFDTFSAQVLKRSGIRALVMDAQDLENFETALQGGEFEGTVVQ